MNRAAKFLGLKSTQFVNVHGMTHSAHASTAMDVAALVHALMAHNKFREIVGAREYRRSPSDSGAVEKKPTTRGSASGGGVPVVPVVRNMRYKNLNVLLGDRRVIPGGVIFGVKTGITPGAGSCLALMATSESALEAFNKDSTATTPDGPVFLSIVLGSESRPRRFIDSQCLLSWAAAAVVNTLDCPISDDGDVVG
jgi:D-alanyl-D-alanine carboxypeptidase